MALIQKADLIVLLDERLNTHSSYNLRAEENSWNGDFYNGYLRYGCQPIYKHYLMLRVLWDKDRTITSFDPKKYGLGPSAYASNTPIQVLNMRTEREPVSRVLFIYQGGLTHDSVAAVLPAGITIRPDDARSQSMVDELLRVSHHGASSILRRVLMWTMSVTLLSSSWYHAKGKECTTHAKNAACIRSRRSIRMCYSRWYCSGRRFDIRVLSSLAKYDAKKAAFAPREDESEVSGNSPILRFEHKVLRLSWEISGQIYYR
ncbi:hypothetical protein F5884DRAFT_755176 [Xylogone sp. PMI_703]|nr:hypothetical protein F5884DRAFT_755176 [Xylogone sp. PMI_703]